MSEMQSLTARNDDILRRKNELYNLLEKLSPQSKTLSRAETTKELLGKYKERLRLCEEHSTEIVSALKELDKRSKREGLEELDAGACH